MFTMLLITFLAIALFITVMSVGVLAGRAPLKGSCGGLNRIGLEGSCEVCGGDLSKCGEGDDKLPGPDPAASGQLFHDAMAQKRDP